VIVQLQKYCAEDYRMLQLCQAVAAMSTCTHKQVGAVIVNKASILGIGYNTVLRCNDRHDKTCLVEHAERVALDKTKYTDGAICYVNLFPCLACQEALASAGIDAIVVFGEQGNKLVHPSWGDRPIYLMPPLPSLLLAYNGERNQHQVVQGELAELITAISNYDARLDRAESKDEQKQALVGEMVDVQLQLQILALTIDRGPTDEDHAHKYSKLLMKFSPIFFPGKELS